MAKTRTDIPDPYFHPGLLIYHAYAADCGTDFDFHVIGLWPIPYFNPGNCLFYVTWPPDDWVNYPDATEEQLLLTRQLIHHPYLICDCCQDCNSRAGVPGRPRWNLPRNGQYQYGYPACPYNGNWSPFQWDPEHWPPEPF